MNKREQKSYERRLQWLKRHFPIGSLVEWSFGVIYPEKNLKKAYALVVDYMIPRGRLKHMEPRVIINNPVNNENMAVFPDSIKNIGKPYKKTKVGVS